MEMHGFIGHGVGDVVVDAVLNLHVEMISIILYIMAHIICSLGSG